LAVVEGRGARPQGSGGEQLVPRTSRRWSWSKASSASRGFVQHAPGRVQQRVDVFSNRLGVFSNVSAYSATCRRVRQRIGVFGNGSACSATDRRVP